DMCESQKGPASKGESTAVSEIPDKSNDGGKESAAMRLEGEVSLGDLIWVKLRRNLWWPAVVVDEKGVDESSRPENRSEGEVLVRLYGSYEYLYADPVKYYSQFKTILEKSNGNCHEIFDKALEQDYSHLNSDKRKGQGSKSTDRSADASKGKKKSNQSGVTGNKKDMKNGKALSERVGKTNSKVSKQDGVKRKLGSSNQVSSRTDKRAKNKANEVNCKSPKQGSVQRKLNLDVQISERTSPGKSPESSARRTRVMQGLGLIAPLGSPFHKN
ncbi:hypothetical protein CCACVL1_30289, partial [Corchorus capsularis]